MSTLQLETTDNLKSEFYKQYVGNFAKRFYTPFEADNIFTIVDFKIISGFAHIQVQNANEETWWWDAEDSVFIVDEDLQEIEDERVANVRHEQYLGYNPYNKTIKEE